MKNYYRNKLKERLTYCQDWKHSIDMYLANKEITKKAITSVKGIGSSLYEKIETILKTGTCPQYESIKNINDPRISFIDIYKIGDKKANELVDSGFTSIQDLRDCEDIENYLTKAQILGLKYYEDFKQKIPREEIIQHEKILKKNYLALNFWFLKHH